jgi:hypothetical protein
VQYFVSREKLPEDILRKTSLLEIPSDSSVIIYENPNAFPVAAFESAPMIPVPIEYHANRLQIHTAGATGTLFVRIAPIKGYHMILANGTQEPVTLTESGVLLSLREPQDIVNVLYRSRTFERGTSIALAGLMLTALGFLITAILSFAQRVQNRESNMFG